MLRCLCLNPLSQATLCGVQKFHQWKSTKILQLKNWRLIHFVFFFYKLKYVTDQFTFQIFCLKCYDIRNTVCMAGVCVCAVRHSCQLRWCKMIWCVCLYFSIIFNLLWIGFSFESKTSLIFKTLFDIRTHNVAVQWTVLWTLELWMSTSDRKIFENTDGFNEEALLWTWIWWGERTDTHTQSTS